MMSFLNGEIKRIKNPTTGRLTNHSLKENFRHIKPGSGILSRRWKERHVNADESFHVTANMVFSLAKRARQIFESSEVEEKRQLLNFVFQNLELKDKKLSTHYREPFKMIKDASFLEKRPGMCPCADSFRTFRDFDEPIPIIAQSRNI